VSIFAYYNSENNRYNRFFKAYRKATVIVIKSIKINDYNKSLDVNKVCVTSLGYEPRKGLSIIERICSETISLKPENEWTKSLKYVIGPDIA